MSDERPCVYVHAETASGDDVRMFYEIPERIAAEVRRAESFEGETFVSCLLTVCLEREGAKAEVKRLSRGSRRR